MAEIAEYDYYEAVLTITVATTRPESAPSNVIAAASMHEEYASRARCLLREFRDPLAAYLPYYGIRKIMPAGSSRDIDREFQQDLIRLQFALGFALLGSAWSADERVVFAFERNIEKAVRDLFVANGLPDVFIPCDTETQGESYIDITVSLGAASNIGAWVTSA